MLTQMKQYKESTVTLKVLLRNCQIVFASQLWKYCAIESKCSGVWGGYLTLFCRLIEVGAAVSMLTEPSQLNIPELYSLTFM